MTKVLAVQPVLMARDVGAALAFYRALGFVEVFRDDADAPRYAAVVRDGVELHLQWNDAVERWPDDMDKPTYRLLVADVADVDALAAEWAGLALDRRGPFDSSWGTRELHVRDPAGNGLQFYRARSEREG